MVLYKWIRELLKKYSFVTDTSFLHAKLYIYYEKNGVTKRKILPYRATRDQLLQTIEAIKKDIDYKEDEIVKERANQNKSDAPVFEII